MPGSVVVGARIREQLGYADQSPVLEIIPISWVGDATDGSVPDTLLGQVKGILQRIVTDPGSPAPTTLYDITIVDAAGFDVLGGAGMDRSATVTQEAEIKMTTFQRVVCDFLVFKLAGNTVAGARGDVYLYVLR